MDKEYSLLRPFDLEAAKTGAPVLQLGGDAYPVRWVARSGNGKTNIVEIEAGHAGLLMKPAYVPDEHLRMAPLCWVDGRPVYPGDDIYVRGKPGIFKVDGLMADDSIRLAGVGLGISPEFLAWTPLTVKREGWVNLYPLDANCGSAIAGSAGPYDSKEFADKLSGKSRIACIRIEWDEPVGGAQ